MKEKILEMTAGRELDALVGLKLGLVKPNVAEAYRTISATLDGNTEKYGMHNLLPNYSTDISAAWEVLEKLVDQGLTVGASKYGENNLYYCHVLRRGIGVCDTQMMKSAPEAICKAALLVVMDQEEKLKKAVKL
jgi:hypothetical protein